MSHFLEKIWVLLLYVKESVYKSCDKVLRKQQTIEKGKIFACNQYGKTISFIAKLLSRSLIDARKFLRLNMKPNNSLAIP